MIAAIILATALVLAPTADDEPLPHCDAGQEAQPFEDTYVCGPADPAVPELLDGVEVEQGGPAPHPLPTFTAEPAPHPLPPVVELPLPPALPEPAPEPAPEQPSPEGSPLLAETGPADVAPLGLLGALIVAAGTALLGRARRAA